MKNLKGNLFIILSACIFGYTPILGRITYNEGSNAVMLTFLRTLCCLPLLLAVLKIQNVSLKVTRSELKELLILSFIGSAVTTVMLYQSYQYIPVGSATTLHFVYPLFTAVGAVVFFKEKLTRSKIVALIFAMLGISLFMGELSISSLPGIILALLSGITYAFYILYLDHSSLLTLHPLKLSFYINLFVAMMVFGYGSATAQITFSLTATGWFYSVIVAILCGFAAITLFQVGVKLAGSTAAAILSMFEPITSVLFGILLLNEPVRLKQLIGCGLILAGVLILTLGQQKKPQSS